MSHEPGSDAWRTWLDQTDQKTFRFAIQAGSFTGRRESKAERSYWYAYRKRAGRLRKAYLGRSEDLTRERLDAIAAQLAGEHTPSHITQPRPSQPEAHGLSTPSTPIIGRDDEIAAIVRRLTQPEVRLLTLTGPGGTGKTRLASAVTQALVPRFADGVWFVDLSAIVDAELVVHEIARHLDIQDVDEIPARDRVQHYLAKREALLVLDNMEQIVAAGHELETLLDASPRLRVLVTSREPLHLHGEIPYPVPPLRVPDLETGLTPNELKHVAAVDLFLERAHEAGATIELNEHTARDIAELCVRLDGLPLAIELAAARSRLLRPRDMLARIARQIELLRSSDNARAARHQSLRAAVGWSYDLLTPSEQHAFRCLSAFAGGCSLDAVEAVLTDPDALDLVASLLDKSLVRNEAGPGGESRLRMLETVRAFGLEQLSASGKEDVIRARHAAYFLSLVKPDDWDALDLPEPDWLEMVGADNDNFRSALRWSLERGDRCVGLELAAALTGFWIVNGYLREGHGWLERAIAAASGLEPKVEAVAHHGAGQLWWRQGDYDRAANHYTAGLGLRRELGDPVGIAIVLQGLASVARDRGDLDTSIALWQECVTVFQACGNRVREARATLNLAIALHLAGQSARAAELLQEIAEVAQHIGQHWAQATALTYLGLIAFEVWRDRGRSAAYVRGALPIASRVSDAWVTSHLLELAAWLAVSLEDGAATAARLFGAAEALRERMGARLHPAFLAGHQQWFAPAWEQANVDAATDSVDEMLHLAMGVAHAAQRNIPSAIGGDRSPAALSVREREIAGLVAQGLTSRQIAERLIVGERTIETHVDHIRAKLGVRSRAQIAAWATDRGLVPSDT